MRPSLLLLIALGLTACDQPFDFYVHVNDYTGGAYQITIDGNPLPDVQNNTTQYHYDSENDALAHPMVIETWRDGMVVDRCELYARCADGCRPTRVSTVVCAESDGQIWLSSWSCPCDGSVADWFCSGDCSETAP